MTIKLSSLQIDLAREKSGVWIPSLQYPGVEWLVSSLYVPAYVNAQEVLNLRLTRKHKNEPVPPEERQLENGKLYARHILHGWRGFDVEYSAEAALQVLTDPSYRPITADIINAALRIGEPDPEFVKTEEGNSAAPSA